MGNFVVAFCVCRCEATGLPTTITIRFKERVFHLHKVCIQTTPTSQAFGYLSQRFSCSEVVLFLCSVIGHSQVGISYKEGAIEELGEVTKAALQGVMFLFGCEVSVDFFLQSM